MTIDEARQQLDRLVESMTPAQLRRALKGALKSEARHVVKAAKQNMRTAPIRRAAALSSGIRGDVMRGTRGFYVSVTPERWGRRKYRQAAAAAARGKKKRRKGIHTNSAGKDKPVLMWAESGTASRMSRGSGSQRRTRGNMFGRKGYEAGRGLGFLKRTEQAEFNGSVSRIHQALCGQIAKIAEKYGKL